MSGLGGRRPVVAVVMPFAGSPVEAVAAIDALGRLAVRAGDELILADNTLTAPEPPAGSGVRVVRCPEERSPAHARNAGARSAGRAAEWLLFLDADVIAPADLIDCFFDPVPGGRSGAVAGEIAAASPGETLAERYAASRSFLTQSAHMSHPYRPRAAAANLLVRRAAFEAVGGFLEGLRAAEDTDFTWRLQAAGWELELRPGAAVEHRYRTTIGELRRQWRGYAAGRAWLARRHAGFAPEPALVRAGRRTLRGGARRGAEPRGLSTASGRPPSDRRFLAVDALLAVDELAGLLLPNRPRSPSRTGSRRRAGARPGTGKVLPAHESVQRVVVVAERFPMPGDPLVALAASIDGARVEAVARPVSPSVARLPGLRVSYREDDGAGERVCALACLLLRHPLRVARDLILAPGGAPTLLALAPAVRRLEADPKRTRVHALGPGRPEHTAERLAALAGRQRTGRPPASGHPERAL